MLLISGSKGGHLIKEEAPSRKTASDGDKGLWSKFSNSVRQTALEPSGR